MADPNPVVDLPEAEFVELYNSGDEAINLTGISLGSGGSPTALSGTLSAGEYLVVTDEAFANAFRNLGAQTLGLNLPGLTNGGDNISLISGTDTLFSIDYTSSWYNDSERDGGGYSIEYTGLTGDDAGCSGKWRASTDPAGGTPGTRNATLGIPADTSPPTITGFTIDSSGIELVFSEALDNPDTDYVLVSAGTEIPHQSLTFNPARTALQLTYPGGLARGQFYTLIIPPLSDCAGNVTDLTEITVGIPDEPAAGDVIINELLFNPGTGGSDFVELYNCSDKIFQIEGWTLVNTLSTASTASRQISSERLFLPGTFLTLTADPEDLVNRYLNVDPELLVDQTLPSLPDDGGNITVIAGAVTLDAFDYADGLHAELLNDDNGVSLERIRYKRPTMDPGNWFSAASVEAYATPTRPNSQARSLESEPITGPFTLLNTTFSPDADGFQDFLELAYSNVAIGSVARIRIFDAQGRAVRTLRDAELLGSDGTILWDGADDEGQRARTGVHILYVELIHPDGPVEGQKLVAVVAGER